MGKEDTKNKPSFNFNRTLSGVLRSSSVPLSAGSSETFINTAERHLSGLIGTMSHPDTQKIRIIGFLLENRLH